MTKHFFRRNKKLKNGIICLFAGKIFFCFCVFLSLTYAQEIQIDSLTRSEIQQIGDKIFANECGSREEYLISWNQGENFLSLGIGHFIWHPAQDREIFEEGFIHFLAYAKASGESIPPWLDQDPFPACPWDSRDDFLASQSDPRIQELREFLLQTKFLQASFIVQQFQQAIPFLLDQVDQQERKMIVDKINALAATAEGIFALIDYVNFKGLGISEAERYQGQGWGLLQVLENMREGKEGLEAVWAFSQSAIDVLEQRVRNSPVSRNEQRWLAGWRNRVNGYVP